MKAREVEVKLRDLSGCQGSQIHVNIDADPVVYAVGFSCQKDRFFLEEGKKLIKEASTRARLLGDEYKQWTDEQLAEEGLTVRKETDVEEWEDVQHTILGHFQSIINYCQAGTWALYLTGSGNWRDEITTIRKYKAGRSTKPILYTRIREYMVKELGAHMIHGMEADDALSIASWNHLRDIKKSGVKGLNNRVGNCMTILASIDKDLRQVPGVYYNPSWGDQVEPQVVTKMGTLTLNEKRKLEFSGLKGFYGQILSGDSVDTIPGVPGCGPVAIYEALKDCENEADLYHTVVETTREYMGDKIEYFRWQDWEDPNSPITKKVIRKGAKPLTITPEQYIRETGNLLYMLRKPLKKGQTHPWKGPRKYA